MPGISIGSRARAAGSRLLRWLVAGSLSRPIEVTTAWALLLLLSTLGIAKLQFETTAGSLLNRNGEAWERYQGSLDQFGGDEIIVAAVEGEKALDPPTLSQVDRITGEMENLSGVRRVDSVFTVPLVRATTDGGLNLDPAIAGDPPWPPAALARVRSELAEDRIAPGTLLSKDGRVIAVNILLDGDVGDRREAIVDEVQRSLGHNRGWFSGVPVFETRVGARTMREIAFFVPITLAMIGLGLFLLFRSTSAVVIPLLTSGAGCWATLGLMGILGSPVTIVAMLLPSVLLALGCAYVMHILTVVQGVTGTRDLDAAIGRVARPIALSGLTTAIGFFAIASVEIDAIRALGAYGGVGVLIVLASALTLAPATIRMWPVRRRASRLHRWIGETLATRLVAVVSRRRAGTVIGWAFILLVSTLGVARLQVETDGARWWPLGSPVRDSWEAIRERLAGMSPMNVLIESHQGKVVTDPQVMARISEFTEYLDALPDVGKAVSIADPIRQLHRGFGGHEGYPVPEDANLIAQYLLLLDSMDQIHDLISEDHLIANVLLRADNNGSTHLLEIARTAEQWWEERGMAGFSAKTTGIMFEFARAEEEISWGQIKGLSLALAAIGVVLLLVFRQPSIAGVALIPNLVPLVVIFGGMGVLGVPLDAGTVCLGSLALGIAVDDTIHVVTTFRSLRNRGEASVASLESSFRLVLPALIYTTVIVGIGFVVLGLSQFTLTRNLGIVTTAVVVICLLADTTLLPALLIRRDECRRSGNRVSS